MSLSTRLVYIKKILGRKITCVHKLVVLERKDLLAVLPIGFGKSLIYQTTALFANFIEREESTDPSWENNDKDQD